MGTVNPIRAKPYDRCPRSTLAAAVNKASHSASAASKASVDWAKFAVRVSAMTHPMMLLTPRHKLFRSELARVASETDSTVQPAHSGRSSSSSMAR